MVYFYFTNDDFITNNTANIVQESSQHCHPLRNLMLAGSHKAVIKIIEGEAHVPLCDNEQGRHIVDIRHAGKLKSHLLSLRRTRQVRARKVREWDSANT